MMTASDVGDIVRQLTREFKEEAWKLKRPDAPTPGWSGMPEFVAADKLRAAGASGPDIRRFITLVSAVDRARDADKLWKDATQLFLNSKWVFDPKSVAGHSLPTFKDTLTRSHVSQRHDQDAKAWYRLLETMADKESPHVFRQAIEEGKGDARALLEALRTHPDRFPLLKGCKISVMWVRMLASPGGANISGLEILPVAVDVQVRKVTEYLGVTDTASSKAIDEDIRNTIQDTWQQGATCAIGPESIAGTAGALDPVLWFFGKWGCTFCEEKKRKTPISPLCEKRCRYIYRPKPKRQRRTL